LEKFRNSVPSVAPQIWTELRNFSKLRNWFGFASGLAMTLVPQTAESAARSLGIALVALALARPLARLLAHTHGRRRTLAWALLLAPLLTPTLLVSYAYSHVALRLITAAGGVRPLYCAALALKLTPLATTILHFVPPALSAEAGHCHALLARSPWQRWIFLLRGAGRAPWIAGGIVFLLAFTDFELASLWSLKTWTVALFDAQTGGLALGESLRLAKVPLCIEAAALITILWRVDFSHAQAGEWKQLTRGACRAIFMSLGLASFLGCALPLLMVAGQALSGVQSLFENFVLTRELAVSIAFALVAAASAWPLARSAHSSRPDRRFRTALICAPGLLGALLLSLFILAVFQLPLLRFAYDSPLPLLLALTLLLLPLAVPLRRLLDAARQDPALHLAQMAGAREVIWQLDMRRRWLAAFLLFCWAYFDFTASSILAPVGLTPVFARLHNLAHYGQTAVLSAMMLAAFAAPVAVLLLTAPAARWYARRDVG
jgi:ABC-type Fe3+ transport system permease subunit